MRPQPQQAVQAWAGDFTSLSNYLLLEVGLSITGHALGSEVTEVTALPLVEANGRCAPHSQGPCSSHRAWLGSVGMPGHTVGMSGLTLS